MSPYWDNFLHAVRNGGLNFTRDANYGLTMGYFAADLLGLPADRGDVAYCPLRYLVQQVSSSGCSTGTSHDGHSYFDVYCRKPATMDSCDLLTEKLLAGLTTLISSKIAIANLKSDDLPKFFSNYIRYLQKKCIHKRFI